MRWILPAFSVASRAKRKHGYRCLLSAIVATEATLSELAWLFPRPQKARLLVGHSSHWDSPGHSVQREL